MCRFGFPVLFLIAAGVLAQKPENLQSTNKVHCVWQAENCSNYVFDVNGDQGPAPPKNVGLKDVSWRAPNGNEVFYLKSDSTITWPTADYLCLTAKSYGQGDPIQMNYCSWNPTHGQDVRLQGWSWIAVPGKGFNLQLTAYPQACAMVPQVTQNAWLQVGPCFADGSYWLSSVSHKDIPPPVDTLDVQI